MRTPSRHFSVSVKPSRPTRSKPGAPRIVGADLESGCEDQAIDGVFGAVDDDAAGRDPLDAKAAGIDEGDVVAVERLQIFVVKAWPLAEVAVPRFEALGGGAVGHDRVDAGPDLLHLGEVGHFDCAQTFFVRHTGDTALPHHEQFLDDARPGVVDQVLVGLTARGEQLEVLDAVTLPAVLEVRRPFRIGRPVAPDIHRGRGALKDEQLLHRPTQVRHALDRGRTGADDPHPLVRQLGQVGAGVVVVPPAGVECAAAEIHDPFDAGKFRLLQVSVGHRDEPRPDLVTVVGGDDPLGKLFVPAYFADLGL